MCIGVYVVFSYTCSCRIHTDAMNNRRAKNSLTKYLPLTLFVRVWKGLLKVCVWEGAGDWTELKYFDPKVMAVSGVSFSFSRAAQPEAQGPICWVMAFFIASYQHLLWTPTHQGPNGPFGLMWLSLPHLVYNSVRSSTQLLLPLELCLD